MVICNRDWMEHEIHVMSQFGDTGNGGVTRYSLTPEAHMARDEFVHQMKEIGAVITSDDLANLYATLPGTEPQLKGIVMGSHCDSVKNGGNYDGILGVMGAMEVLRTISEQKIPHRHNITAMIWTNEEGSLYPPSMMCSGIVTHDYLPEDIASDYEYADMMNAKSILDSSKTFGMALAASPYKGDRKNRISPDKYKAMFELHIEQGPILEDSHKDIGVVTCVLGLLNYRIIVKGVANHSGTTPMNKRKDAFFAASCVLQYLHEKLDALGEQELVYTTGEVICHPNVHTVIPDYFEFSLDARHEDVKIRQKVIDIIENMPKKVAGCEVSFRRAWVHSTVYYDHELIEDIQSAVDELGYSNMKIHSGAGHDAQFCSYMIPTAMIFVPSHDGRSHCEAEYTSPELCTEGASVMLNAVLKCDAAN